MKLELISATLKQPTWRECLDSWSAHTLREWSTRLMENDLTGQSLMESYQTAFEESPADVLGYIHDDLVMHDPLWYQRVMREFQDDEVGLVGFAGALGHGSIDLYTSPYKLSNLGRVGFVSNMRDAETHGVRFGGSCDVSVLDGMALFVRRELLAECGGWPLGGPVGYIGYDYWMSCMARRHGYHVRVVGCACDHLGGKSTGLNKDLDPQFEEAHLKIWEEFRDVLPGRVGGGR